MMLFGEKYGDVVRVVEIPGYSRELCGGTHVTTTAEVGPFAILSEGSVGSGVRRIEAVTAGEAYALLHERARRGGRAPRASSSGCARRRSGGRRRPSRARRSPPRCEPKAGVNVIVQSVDGLDADALLDLSDRFKQRHAPAAVVLGTTANGSVHLVANFDESVAAKVSANDVVRQAAALVGGGGGGRPTMARAGGKEPARLDGRAAHGRGADRRRPEVKVLALDYGAARTGRGGLRSDRHAGAAARRRRAGGERGGSRAASPSSSGSRPPSASSSGCR